MKATIDKTGRWLDRRRLEITLRTVLGVGVGYALSALLAAALSLVLPMSRSEAVLAATMLAFLGYCALIIWAYAASSLWRLAAIWSALGGLLGLAVDWGGRG